MTPLPAERRRRATSPSSPAQQHVKRKAAAYARRLDELATRQEAAWEQAGVLIETKNPRNYDIAVTLLSDLRALAELRGETAAFTSRFLALRQQHQR